MKKSKSLEYTSLKKSLESLGYNEPLGPDSTILVNHLLSDLNNKSEDLRKCLEEKEKLSLELKKQGNLVLPLRKENMRITKENNDLHNQMIKLEDNLDKFKIVNSEYYKKVEQERDDYKILINQKDSLIKNQLNEIDSLKKKCTELLDKINFGNRCQNLNLNNLNKSTTNDLITKTGGRIMVGGDRMEISENLIQESRNENEIESFKNELNTFNMNKESWVNDLKQADREAEKLRNEIRNLKKEIDEKERTILNYKNQIDFRDNEINKLQSNKFIGDNNTKELELKYNNSNMLEENEKLKSQIDVLNQENHKLQEKDYFHSHRCREEEIKKLEKIINGLNKENETLQQKLLESDKKTAVKKEKNEINYKNNMTKLNNEIKNLNDELKNMNNIRINLEKENALLKDKITSLNQSAQKKEESKKIFISQQDTEKNNLNKKIEELTYANDISQKINNLSITDLKEGMNVFVKKINQVVTIISISKEGKIQVQTSLGKMYFEIEDIEITNNKSNNSNVKKDYSSKKDFKVKSISSEINVIGQTVDEACFSIDKYLDNCYLVGLNSIRIVHGKGTGALRKGIHEFLKTHPHVKSFRVGTFGEGEMGVTIVEIK